MQLHNSTIGKKGSSENLLASLINLNTSTPSSPKPILKSAPRRSQTLMNPHGGGQMTGEKSPQGFQRRVSVLDKKRKTMLRQSTMDSNGWMEQTSHRDTNYNDFVTSKHTKQSKNLLVAQ